MLNFSKIAVVIPFYEGEAYIQQCVASLQKEQAACPIYIIDNSPSPSQLLATWTAEGVTIMRTQPKIGFGRACNVGAYRAVADGAEVIVILNQDTVVAANFIEYLTRPLLESELGIAVPLVFDYAFTSFTKVYANTQFGHFKQYFYDVVSGENIKSHYLLKEDISGVCFALKAEVLKQVGLFDPLFFMYGEDNDFSRRCQHLGILAGLVPKAQLGHVHSNATATDKARKNINFLRREAVALLLLKTPTHSFSSGCMRALKWLFGTYVKAVVRGQFERLPKFMVQDITLLGKIRQVYRHRQLPHLLNRTEQQVEKDKG